MSNRNGTSITCNSKRCIVEVDGSSKGNPGRAGGGAVILGEDGRVISRVREGLGHATNNEAEYRGLNRGLETALSKGCTDVTVKTDSQLVFNQVQDYWKTRNPKLRELCDETKRLKNEFDSFKISHVPRGLNSDADAQANQAANLRAGEVQYEHGDAYYRCEGCKHGDVEDDDHGDAYSGCEDGDHGDADYSYEDDSEHGVAYNGYVDGEHGHEDDAEHEDEGEDEHEDEDEGEDEGEDGEHGDADNECEDDGQNGDDDYGYDDDGDDWDDGYGDSCEESDDDYY